jgi:hypothetical protein
MCRGARRPAASASRRQGLARRARGIRPRGRRPPPSTERAIDGCDDRVAVFPDPLSPSGQPSYEYSPCDALLPYSRIARYSGGGRGVAQDGKPHRLKD